jgi:hypothetical protein
MGLIGLKSILLVFLILLFYFSFDLNPVYGQALTVTDPDTGLKRGYLYTSLTSGCCSFLDAYIPMSDPFTGESNGIGKGNESRTSGAYQGFIYLDANKLYSIFYSIAGLRNFTLDYHQESHVSLMTKAGTTLATAEAYSFDNATGMNEIPSSSPTRRVLYDTSGKANDERKLFFEGSSNRQSPNSVYYDENMFVEIIEIEPASVAYLYATFDPQTLYVQKDKFVPVRENKSSLIEVLLEQDTENSVIRLVKGKTYDINVNLNGLSLEAAAQAYVRATLRTWSGTTLASMQLFGPGVSGSPQTSEKENANSSGCIYDTSDKSGDDLDIGLYIEGDFTTGQVLVVDGAKPSITIVEIVR